MKKKTIHYILPLGRRCNISLFLRERKLIRFASPFDWVICDFESALDCIKSGFPLFLTNIMTYKKNTHFSSHNTTTIDIHEKLKEKLDQLNLCYMKNNYNNELLKINTNYLPQEIDNDFYRWNRIILYPHHNPAVKTEQDKFNRRIKRLNNLLKKEPSYTLLIYMDIIINGEDEEKRTIEVEKLYNQYDIPGHICYIMPIVTTKPFRYRKYKNLTFIYFPVTDYETQFKTLSGSDNNIIDKTLDWNGLENTIRTVYNIDLKGEELPAGYTDHQ